MTNSRHGSAAGPISSTSERNKNAVHAHLRKQSSSEAVFESKKDQRAAGMGGRELGRPSPVFAYSHAYGILEPVKTVKKLPALILGNSEQAVLFCFSNLAVV
jgi:hypothetical protein